MADTDTDTEAAAFDQYTDELSNEATQALDDIQQLVTEAETAADETADLAEPVIDILQELSAGDRAGAVQAAMVLFSDDTSKDIAEARAACLAALAAADDAVAEADDVFAMLAQQVSGVVDAIASSDLADRLRSLF